MRVKIEGASGNVLDVGSGGQLGGQVASGNVIAGSVTVTDSTTATTFLTVPAGRTFAGQVTIVANSRATTAAYGTASCVVTGTNAVPATGTAIIIAGSSRDAGVCPVTQAVQIIAPAGNAVTLQLVNSTATTFNSSACANGQLI
jgi:DNA-binding beta-propeller fold protein YncE